MGKVLDSFMHLFPGAVSRTADEIVISLKNAGNGAIYPGTAVFLAADGGVTAVRPGSTFDEFVGIAVRSGAKTPNDYGNNTGKYNQNEMADILVRGSAVVVCYSGTPAMDGAVYIIKANGRFSADASTGGVDNVLIPNAKWLGGKDSSNRAEIVLTERSL